MDINSEWEISVQDTKGLLDRQGEFLLLDCRQPEEFQIARIAGAHLVPLPDLPAKVDEIRTKASGKTVVVHCHHGGRSLQAAALLRKAGLPGVKSMAGGIDAWSMLIDPTVPRYM